MLAFFQKVTCGSDHSLALTLTGSVFAWGDNSSGQLANSPPGGQKICSTPTEVPLPTGETARDIAAFENRSLILTDSGKVYCFGGGSKKLHELDLSDTTNASDESDGSPQSIAFVDVDVIALAVKFTDLPVSNFKSVEKLFLKKLCAIFYQVGTMKKFGEHLNNLIPPADYKSHVWAAWPGRKP